MGHLRALALFVEKQLQAREGQRFQLQPIIRDDDEQDLSLRIINKPSWLSFNDQTGRLIGTPDTEHVGTQSNIVIYVNDGITEVASQAFSIVVNSTSATISWRAPSVRADNSPLPLSELAGYRIYSGTHPDRLLLLEDIPDPTVTKRKYTGLKPATYYYAIAAYNQQGVEGAQSSVVSKQIR